MRWLGVVKTVFLKVRVEIDIFLTYSNKIWSFLEDHLEIFWDRIRKCIKNILKSESLVKLVSLGIRYLIHLQKYFNGSFLDTHTYKRMVRSSSSPLLAVFKNILQTHVIPISFPYVSQYISFFLCIRASTCALFHVSRVRTNDIYFVRDLKKLETTNRLVVAIFRPLLRFVLCENTHTRSRSLHPYSVCLEIYRLEKCFSVPSYTTTVRRSLPLDVLC